MPTAAEAVAESATIPATTPPPPAEAAEGSTGLAPETAPTTTTAEGSTAPAAELTREELLTIENARLTRELAAMVEQRKRAAELVDEADRADDVYETAKAEAKKAKEAREVAKASLRALIHGDATVAIDFNGKDDGKQAPGQVEAPRGNSGVGDKLRAVAGSYGVWQFGLTRKALEDADVSALRQIEPELAKRKVGAVEILGDKPFVPLEQVCYEDGSGFFVLWPLLDTDAWDATCAEKYAHALRDLGDESPDITARRKTGGEFCGVTVKRGRRKLVVGPDDQAVRVVYAPEGINGADGGYVASKLLGAEPAKVLSFPAGQLPDRMEGRLREYQPLNGSGYHEALADALACDLKVSEAEIVKAAEGDSFRFEVRLDAAFSTSVQVVRLLIKDEGDGAELDDEADDAEDEG